MIHQVNVHACGAGGSRMHSLRPLLMHANCLGASLARAELRPGRCPEMRARLAPASR